MAIRKIIKIDEEKCNGCGLCIPNCPEGALKVIDGKLRLVSDIFCDGLGACIGHCPTGAITIEAREAEAYDEKQAMADKDELAKGDKIEGELLGALEGHFQNDTMRINHAKAVLHFAKQLLKKEGADERIVTAASVLHDVGIKTAEEKYGSSAAHYQQKEGPAVAAPILAGLGFSEEEIREVCEIIAFHHSPGRVNTKNFKTLYDADRLVNLKDEAGAGNKDKLKKLINRTFLTDAGRELALKTNGILKEGVV